VSNIYITVCQICELTVLKKLVHLNGLIMVSMVKLKQNSLELCADNVLVLPLGFI